MGSCNHSSVTHSVVQLDTGVTDRSVQWSHIRTVCAAEGRCSVRSRRLDRQEKVQRLSSAVAETGLQGIEQRLRKVLPTQAQHSRVPERESAMSEQQALQQCTSKRLLCWPSKPSSAKRKVDIPCWNPRVSRCIQLLTPAARLAVCISP